MGGEEVVEKESDCDWALVSMGEYELVCYNMQGQYCTTVLL